jgi:hypothetical protein
MDGHLTCMTGYRVQPSAKSPEFGMDTRSRRQCADASQGLFCRNEQEITEHPQKPKVTRVVAVTQD